MLYLVQSNRLDPLAEAMLQRWDPPAAGDGPPPSQTIIVPGAALQRWLSQRIADRFGICAGVDFRFAASFIWSTFSQALPGIPEQSPFDRDVVTLRLFAMLEKLPRRAAFAPLRRYVERTDELRRLELARRIAQVYSQYMVYRPDWLARWDHGQRVGLSAADTEAWQSALWTELRGSLGAEQMRHPRQEFFEVLAQQGPDGIVPPRLRVFGLPSIPPMYAQVLVGLARHVDVEWFHLNPSPEFWADIRNEKAKARMELREDPAASLTDVGHPLLASWGEQRRQQGAVLAEAMGGEGADGHDCFVEPGHATVLARLQQSLYDLKDPTAPVLVPADGDHSLQIHVCHSLTRQLEVLHDRLQALFDSLPGLKASEVAVLVPDLDGAAPVIDAVFGAAPRGRAIPYEISGRSRADDTAFLQAVQFLLQLPESRFDAASVLGFLEVPAALARFGLDASQLGVLRTWLHEAGARWGLDAAHRARVGVPAESRHTWAEALHRLLLGYTLPTGSDTPFHGLLPFGELEGAQARTLGTLAQVLATLAEVAESLARPRPVADWVAEFRVALDRCLAPTAADLADDERLRDALAELEADDDGPTLPVGLAAARDLLLAQVARRAYGAMPSGKVVFCGLGPLRGLPYRVLCLVGLDHDIFPRNPPRLEFDLMADAPRNGDRKPREEDRGTFLDALACARDVFYVSYTGRSIRDNAALPPSVVISELLDYLGRFHPGGADGARTDFVTAHPLQPFDLRQFQSTGPWFSYDADLLPAARALQQPLANRPAVRGIAGDDPLPVVADGGTEIDLDDLTWFFQNPATAFLKRLGVRVQSARAEISPDEPFELDEPWLLEDALLQRRLAGWPIEQCVEYGLARTDVPHGAWGHEAVERRAAKVEAFAQRVTQEFGEPLPPVPIEVVVPAGVVRGALAGLRAQGQLGYGLQNEGTHALLPWWLRHLALCAAQPAGVAPVTRLLLADAELEFSELSPEQAREHLADLCAAYREGQCAPLPFFPKSAWALVTGDGFVALKKWQGESRGTREISGEREHPRYRLLFGGEPDTPPPGWEECAGRILGPMLAACKGLDGLADDDAGEADA